MNVDMDGPTLDQNQPYFRTQCLKMNEKTKQYLFKRPGTPFKLLLLISSSEWERYENAYDEIEEIKAKSSAHSSQKVPSTTAASTSTISSATTSIEMPPTTVNSLSLIRGNSVSLAVRDPITSSRPVELSKRSRSDSLAVPTTPPQAKKTAVFTSPSREQVMGVLAFGGVQTARHSGGTNATTINGFFAPIPSVSFMDIIGGSSPFNRFDFDLSKIDALAILSVDFTFEAELGHGGFKTCHPATLYLTSSIRLMSATELVMKELYENKGTTGQVHFFLNSS
ncbi:hypothetical protein VKT23_012038 [Stygiomarasmius scandens]|uniref:Uncharacterized protein n=1 Tax=Marasmiellus scandens TaxID=2682957 RepID=A0ABR1J6R5_9AGAR